MADRVGQRLGNYLLVRLLGQGGFAEVYLGEHLHLGIQAAVKVLYTRLANPIEVESFGKEARTIAHLVHPHIARVFDFDVQDGTPFLVMDYAPHGTLRQRHPKGTVLPLSTMVPYVKQIAEALQHAHDEKLIHRDIKPENILLGQRNEILLSDFGIALIAQSSRYQSTQDAVGTVAYMAPEQIQVKPSPASDQYSLGIVVYEWLCGDRPFHGSFIELCAQHTFAPPPPLHEKLPNISPDVEQVVMTALAKDPQQRFGSVLAFARALEQASQSAPPEHIHVFFSYARRDQNLRDQLENHLSNLKYRGLITTWHAREISAGEETIQQIDIQLNTAHIVLLLISANFLASKYCYSREMMRALQRHERGEAHVIPVLLRPVVFTDTPFAKLQPLPTNRKPVVNWRNRDSAFVDIALGIERVVRGRLASTSLPPPPLSLPPFASSWSPSASSWSPSPLSLPPSLRGGRPSPSSLPPSLREEQPSPSSLPPSLREERPSPSSLSLPSRGLMLVGLSLLGLLSAGILLVQHPNFIPFVGVIVGSLILLAGILLAIRTLVKRAQSRATRRREQEQAQRQQAEATRRREQQRQEERRREQEQAQRRQAEEARRREQQRQEERRREQEEARRRELEEARRPEQERTYYEKALAAYEQALRQNNVDATAYRGKGNALIGLERYDEALTAFEQALVLTPLPTTYVSVGNVLTTLRRCDEAVAAYEQALALDASYTSAYAGMSKALLQLGRTQEAEQSREQAKQLGDDD